MCRTPFRTHADYIVRLLSGRIMRGGILIVGSLLWDRRRERDEWRQARLRIDDAVHVRVPIRYGRYSGSRGDTFTMTFADDGKLGQGVLVPCRTSVVDAAALLAEATDLWKAEQPSAPTESIGASWGCVGVLFRSQGAPDERFEAWSHYFRRKSSPISPVDSVGVLRIPWPVLAADGTAAKLDVILATATKADAARPLPEDIANAWISQDQGHELYFFENVRHGIRTPDDLLIWKRIENAKPSWLRNDAYTEAIAVLQREVALEA